MRILLINDFLWHYQAMESFIYVRYVLLDISKLSTNIYHSVFIFFAIKTKRYFYHIYFWGWICECVNNSKLNSLQGKQLQFSIWTILIINKYQQHPTYFHSLYLDLNSFYEAFIFLHSFLFEIKLFNSEFSKRKIQKLFSVNFGKSKSERDKNNFPYFLFIQHWIINIMAFGFYLQNCNSNRNW